VQISTVRASSLVAMTMARSCSLLVEVHIIYSNITQTALSYLGRMLKCLKVR
jgi:hypothetical protein